MLVRDRSDFLLGSRLQGIRQNMDAQARTAGVRRHGVGEMLELCGYDDDRRLPPVRGRDRVVDAPGGAGASVAEPDDGDLDAVGELVQLRERAVTLFADPVAGTPDLDFGADTDQLTTPFVEHPLERAPRRVVANPDRSS